VRYDRNYSAYTENTYYSYGVRSYRSNRQDSRNVRDYDDWDHDWDVRDYDDWDHDWDVRDYDDWDHDWDVRDYDDWDHDWDVRDYDDWDWDVEDRRSLSRRTVRRSVSRDDHRDIKVRIDRGYAGVCGVNYRFPIGDNYWCDDREVGARVGCQVLSATLHMCCMDTDGCYDHDDMKYWRF
jgi:hypothetical protein